MSPVKLIRSIFSCYTKMGDIAMEEKNIPVTVGSLIYDDTRNCLILDGYELSQSDNIEIRGFWFMDSGQVAIDWRVGIL